MVQVTKLPVCWRTSRDSCLSKITQPVVMGNEGKPEKKKIRCALLYPLLYSLFHLVNVIKSLSRRLPDCIYARMNLTTRLVLMVAVVA